MEPFKRVEGIVTPLDRANVDTDQICPAEFLKRIERTGYEEFLFWSWRRNNPDFVLNHPVYKNGTILVAGRNFGGGSSREHAVWAIYQYGFKAVIAPNFAEIFHNNSFENGLCPVLLPEAQVQRILDNAKANPGYRLTVDLESETVTDGETFSVPFVVHNNPETHQFRRYCLLNGLDSIGLTLQHVDKIAAYERQHAS